VPGNESEFRQFQIHFGRSENQIKITKRIELAEITAIGDQSGDNRSRKTRFVPTGAFTNELSRLIAIAVISRVRSVGDLI